MNSRDQDWQARVVTLLRELVSWTRFQALPAVRATLEAELGEDRKKLAFESTDGQRTLREVAKSVGVPTSTIQGWWDRWFRLGIVRESGVRAGRMERLCSLRDVGLEVPKLKGKPGERNEAVEREEE
jgi:transposase